MAMGVMLAAAGMVIGTNIPATNHAYGEVTGTPEPPTFQAGSVPILREISATLRQMDARLARLEVSAQKMQATAARGAVAQPADPSGIAN
jgi:hypothetical protein